MKTLDGKELLAPSFLFFEFRKWKETVGLFLFNFQISASFILDFWSLYLHSAKNHTFQRSCEFRTSIENLTVSLGEELRNTWIQVSSTSLLIRLFNKKEKNSLFLLKAEKLYLHVFKLLTISDFNFLKKITLKIFNCYNGWSRNNMIQAIYFYNVLGCIFFRGSQNED